MRIISVVGARPNFMKIAPLVAECARVPGISHLLVHTGQHYDPGMSEVFFRDLSIPAPDIDLGVGSASHAVQTAQIMIEFEKVCARESPDLVIVVGDVNSTMAATLVAAKLNIPVAHVEAGLRSFDRAMPEEINRVVTDQLADYLFTTSREADENLKREGVNPERIHFVGNVMIDTLLKHRERADGLNVASRLGIEGDAYALMTLHRPSNVDNRATLQDILTAVQDISTSLPVIFPIHPRTSQRIREFELDSMVHGKVQLTEPLGYLEFLNLMARARLVLTDSGGLQEETTILGVPCLTIRENTERPVTISEGSNELVGTDPDRIRAAAERILSGKWKTPRVPEFWDGKAAERIVAILTANISA
jgi:UDP-N-acetylglucosamine 2-epimerase (non-hydrolysing)